MSRVVTARAPGRDSITVTVDEWEKVIDANDTPDAPYMAFSNYGICPDAAITPLSRFILATYAGCGGVGKYSSPQDYWGQTVAWLQASSIVTAELRKLAEVKRG